MACPVYGHANRVRPLLLRVRSKPVMPASQPMVRSCSDCGTSRSIAARCCPACGHALAPDAPFAGLPDFSAIDPGRTATPSAGSRAQTPSGGADADMTVILPPGWHMPEGAAAVQSSSRCRTSPLRRTPTRAPARRGSSIATPARTATNVANKARRAAAYPVNGTVCSNNPMPHWPNACCKATTARPPVPTSAPATQTATPTAPKSADWQRNLRAELARCKPPSFFARVACDEKARWNSSHECTLRNQQNAP